MTRHKHYSIHCTVFEAVGVAESPQFRRLASKLPVWRVSYFGNLTALGNFVPGAEGEGRGYDPMSYQRALFLILFEIVGERSQSSAWLMVSLCTPWFRRFRRSQRLGLTGLRG